MVEAEFMEEAPLEEEEGPELREEVEQEALPAQEEMVEPDYCGSMAIITPVVAAVDQGNRDKPQEQWEPEG